MVPAPTGVAVTCGGYMWTPRSAFQLFFCIRAVNSISLDVCSANFAGVIAFWIYQYA